ncbi:MAG TPA: hypothetical protein VK395_10960 [Gemmataceae bacterium]|nr:hypothetical protein [Gemmataceae bacterium]
MPICISRQYCDTSFGGNPNVDEKILIFEDRVIGWQIAIAEELRRLIDDPKNKGTPIQHAGFALLSILFSYFEMITQYKRGKDSKGKSDKFIKRGLDDVFPNRFTDGQRKDIANLVRNGLYHTTFTKKGVLLHGQYEKSIEIKDGNVLVNPHRLVDDIKVHFEQYIQDLKSRKIDDGKFEKMYDYAMNP